MVAKTKKELKEGFMSGSLKESSNMHLRISSLGVVLKKSPGECRLVHHLN